jgi:hypothetical protein
MKRAESHAIKQRFDVPFEVVDGEEPVAPPEASIEGEFTEHVDTSTGEIVSQSSESPRDVSKDTEDLFGKAASPTATPFVTCEGHGVPLDRVNRGTGKAYHLDGKGKVCTGIPLPEALATTAAAGK